MSNEKVKTTNKLKIAIISLSCALVLAIGGVIGIWAASQQTVSSTFTVNYSIGENVAVAVGARAGYPTDAYTEGRFSSSTTMPTCSHGHGFYAMNVADNSHEDLSLVGGNFGINVDSQIPFFVNFYIENLSDEALSVTVKNDAYINNLWHEYYLMDISLPEGYPTSDIWSIDCYGPSRQIWLNEVTDEDAGNTYSTYTFQVDAGEIIVFQIAMGIMNKNKNANYTCDADNPISFEFVQASTVA